MTSNVYTPYKPSSHEARISALFEIGERDFVSIDEVSTFHVLVRKSFPHDVV